LRVNVFFGVEAFFFIECALAFGAKVLGPFSGFGEFSLVCHLLTAYHNQITKQPLKLKKIKKDFA